MNSCLISKLILPLVLVIGLGFFGGSFAQGQPSAQDFQRVTWMEEAIFQTTYRGESINERLTRLETVVFGEPHLSTSPENRLQKLHDALIARQKTEAETVSSPEATQKPGKQPFKPGKIPLALEEDSLPPLNAQKNGEAAEISGLPKSQKQSVSQPLPADSDYPALTLMEQRVFGRYYEGEELDSRLERIEQKVFGMPQKGPYYARVDNLRLVVLGDTTVGGANTLTGYSNQPPAHSNYFPGIPPQQAAPYNSVNMGQTASTAVPSPPGQTPYGTGYPQYPMGAQQQTGSYGQAPSHPNVSADIASALTSVEEQVLGETYPMDSNNQRLDRLETKIFNQTSPNIPEEDRLQRVIAVAAAEGGDEPIGATSGGVKSSVKSLWPLIPFIILMFL